MHLVIDTDLPIQTKHVNFKASLLGSVFIYTTNEFHTDKFLTGHKSSGLDVFTCVTCQVKRDATPVNQK